MVNNRFLRPYLDSSVFFAWVKQEDIPAAGGLPRWEIVGRIFREAEAGQYPIYTSVAAIAEVRRIQNQSEPLAAVELAQIRAFFQRSFIQTADVTREIAEKAQELGAAHGLTPIDAIHLATAILLGCDVLLVWDKRFSQRFEGRPVEGLIVTEPY